MFASGAPPFFSTTNTMSLNTRNAPISEEIIAGEVQTMDPDLNLRYERLEPFSPIMNIEGLPWREYQSMHIERVWNSHPSAKEKAKNTIVIMFHGGGGNSGEATSKKKLTTAAALTRVYGVDVFIPEYPRGWTNYNPFEAGDDNIDPNSMITQGRIFQEPPEAFARQEAAARLSFRHCQKAVEWISNYMGHPKIILEGTSFGGAIALQIGLMSDVNANIAGIISGFGGLNLEDMPIRNPKIPTLLAGGALDPIVPWFQGPYYMREDAVMGVGGGYLVDAINDAGGKALSVCTIDKGHVWGAACPLYGRIATLSTLDDATLKNFYIKHFDLFGKLLKGEVSPGKDTYEMLDEINFVQRDDSYEAERFAERANYWTF